MRRVAPRLASALLLAALGGCASLPDFGGPRATPDAAQQLLFADRLAMADRSELARLGPELRDAAREADAPGARLRYALWLATPGHGGHDREAARRRLERLLADGDGLSPALRALVRLELRELRARAGLRADRAQLAQEKEALQRENEQLREKIRALTELERAMGAGEE